MRKITKLRRSIKAISPVISVLLMIAIAVVASLVAYAWIMGFIGSNTEKSGKAVQIQSSATTPSGTLDVYVQNVGQGAVTLDPAGCVYVNDQLQILDASAFGSTTLNSGETTVIHTAFVVPTDGSGLKIKVVTMDGTFTQTGTSPNTSGGSGTTQYTASFAVAGPSGSGTTSPSTPQIVNAGSSISIQANANTGYHFTSWTATGSIAVTDANAASTTATINGDGTITANFAAIQLATPTVPAPTLTLPSPITLGGSVTASVTITGSAGTSTGTVTFQYSTDSGTTWNTLGAVKTLSGGSATSDSYTPQAVGGNYRFRAQYSGDSNYNSVTSSETSLTVNGGSGTFGNNQQGTNTQNIEDRITGGQFTCTQSGTAQSISAYIIVSSTRDIKAAIYTTSGTLVGSTAEVSVSTYSDEWVTFSFTGTKPALTAGTSYILVVWSENPSGYSFANLYYSSSGGTAKYDTDYYGTWPSSVTFSNGDGNRNYSIYCTYSIP